eukprot:2728845-Amphidinium_carterae.1
MTNKIKRSQSLVSENSEQIAARILPSCHCHVLGPRQAVALVITFEPHRGEKNRKDYSGTTSGDTIEGIAPPATQIDGRIPQMTWDEKKKCWGTRWWDRASIVFDLEFSDVLKRTSCCR